MDLNALPAGAQAAPWLGPIATIVFWIIKIVSHISG